MPSCCTLYKGLISLVIALIVVEYFFGTIIENKHWDSVFPFNATRASRTNKNVEQIHSPLLRFFSKKISNTTRLNSTLNFNLTTTSSNVTASNVGALFELSSSAEFEASTEHKVINSTELPPCPETPPDLGTSVKVIKTNAPSILDLERRFSWLKPGGHWFPETCRVLKKVALVIPFRCRAEHLLLFLQHMHPFLRKQQLDYTVFIVEQEGGGFFNRASLMNVGFKEALKIDNFDCFIFHDIDLLPEDERNLYNCPEQPRHMSVAIDSFNYKLPYTSIFGGVSAISTEHFELLNGFSNSFWGWGGEDDDMSNRLRYHNLYISRYPISVARYTMLVHKKEKANPNRYDTLKAGKQKYDTDGLSNLKYEMKQIKRNLLYTWLFVEIGPHS